MIEFNANGLSITPMIAQVLIDKAISNGHDKVNLRLAAGRCAIHAIQNALAVASDMNTLRYEAENGIPASGLFAGIPYHYDESVSDDDIKLQIILGWDDIGIIRGASRMRADCEIHGYPK